MMRLAWMTFLAAAAGCDDPGPCPESGSCQYAGCSYPGPEEECAFEWKCTQSDPCGEVRFIRDDQTDEIRLETPDVARCVLEGLRDGVEGGYRWYITRSMLPGQFSTSKRIDVRPSRVALLTESTLADLGGHRTYEGPAALQDSAFFGSCLAETAGEAIYQCLESAVVGGCR